MSRISPKPPVFSSKSASSTRTLPWIDRLYAFWKFSRPHTIIGTSLSVIGLYLIALAEAQHLAAAGASIPPMTLLLPALVACLCGNIYIVGLNQMEDVFIDRINKPHLPIAAGEFSWQQARVIVVIAGVLAIGLALSQGPFLFGMVAISLLIGTAYSLPPIRLKRFPFWASLCIFTVRGVIVNLGLYLHYRGGFPISAPVWALTAFVLVFTFAIAIFKDIPDIEGDRQYNISTFTLRLGQQTVFKLALWVITACYIGMVLAGIIGLPSVNPGFLVVTHVMALGLLWVRNSRVNLQDKASISQSYQFIWKLFFLEYLMFPIACLLA